MQQEAGIPFLNVFNRGMHRDSYPTKQPEGTYIEMRNCVLTSVNGNNLVVRDCMGNALTFAINSPYVPGGSTFALASMPIAFISYPNGTMVVLSTNDTSEDGGYGEIGIVRMKPYGEGVQPDSETGQNNAGYTPLYHHADLNFTRAFRIEGFAYPENDEQQKFYWTDNLNSPRVFNIADPVYTTYILTGSLVTGQQYMVLEGKINHGAGPGTNYGPGLTATNVFTAVNANYTDLTGPSPTAKVIEYIPFERLSWQPDRAIPNLKFKEFGSGNKYCGGKVYFTRYGTDDGYRTPWSYGASPINIPFPNNPYTFSIPYHDTVGAGTTTTLVDSGKSIKVDVTGIDTRFDVIELACAEYDNLFDVPRIIAIVLSTQITGTTMTLEDTGVGLNSILTDNDLTLFPASILKIKSITTSKKYILGANITSRPELPFTNQTFSNPLTGVTISAVEYPMPAYWDTLGIGGLMRFDPVVPIPDINPGPGSISPRTKWAVTDATGGSVEYPVGSGTFYGLNAVFTGVTGSTSATIPVGTIVRPCVTKNRYTVGGNRVEDYIVLTGEENSFWDTKSAAVASHVTGNWSGEKYRYAAVFEDLKGNPYFARWLGDFTMPSITDKGGLMIEDTYLGVKFYSLNPSGVKISGLSIPVADAANIGGFRIVRAVRDPRILAQGLVAQCTYNSGDNIYRPTAWAFPEGSEDPAAGPDSSSNSLFQFICPDHLVNFEKFPLTGENATMEMAAWLDAVAYPGGGTPTYTKSKNNAQSCQSTFVLPLTGDSLLQASTITLWKEYNEGQGDNNYDGGGAIWQNTMLTDTGAGVAITDDTDCGGAGVTDLADRDAQGGRKFIFEREDNINQYSSSDAYNSSAEVGNPKKILMNYCNSNTNPYGGTGDEALATTLYISTGHYQPLTTAVKAATLVGSNYVFNDIEIFGGDCFVSMVDYGYSLWDDSLSVGSARYSQGWFFPCESNTNYGLRRGRKTTNVELYYDDGVDPGTKPNEQAIAYFITGNGTRLEGLSYNQGYSTEGSIARYAALPVNFVNASEFPTQIVFAGPKISGELTDSFRTILVNDHYELDGQGGDINKIAIKDGRVIVWQKEMMQTVPVLERQVVTGLNGAETAIGTGGVVDRNDVIKSHLGTQHQWSVTETPWGYLWFDMCKKEMGILDTGIGEASTALGMRTFFQEIFLEAKGADVNKDLLLNSPTYAQTSDRPLMGVGISGGYDPKLGLAFMTFKFKYHYKVAGNFNYIDKDFTVVYDRERKYFAAFFDFWPGIMHTHGQTMLAVNCPSNPTKYFGANMPSTAFVAGEEISWFNGGYICILAVTVAAYPVVGAAGDPDVDTTHWDRISRTDQLWAHNQPSALSQTTAPDYIYSSFFGRAVNSLIKFVINPPVEEDFYVGNAEHSTPTNVRYTDVSITNESGTATDASIRSSDPNYVFKFSKIAHSFPLSSSVGKLIGKYLIVTFTKKNWTADPRVVDKAVKVLESVKSFFTIKK